MFLQSWLQMSTGFHVSLKETRVNVMGRQAWNPSSPPLLSLNICVFSPTYLIKRPELDVVTGLFITVISQTWKSNMEPDLNQRWRKLFPGSGFFNLLRHTVNVCCGYLVCSVVLVYICFVSQVLRLRQEESLSCCLGVCLNGFNSIWGPPAGVTLCMKNRKLPFDHLTKWFCASTYIYGAPSNLTWHCIWNGLCILLISCV